MGEIMLPLSFEPSIDAISSLWLPEDTVDSQLHKDEQHYLVSALIPTISN